MEEDEDERIPIHIGGSLSKEEREQIAIQHSNYVNYQIEKNFVLLPKFSQMTVTSAEICFLSGRISNFSLLICFLLGRIILI